MIMRSSFHITSAVRTSSLNPLEGRERQPLSKNTT